MRTPHCSCFCLGVSLCFCLGLLLGAALPAASAPVGSQTSQLGTFSVNVDDFAYRVNATANYTRTTGGLGVNISPGTMFSVIQPAGPENNSGYSVFFTIPQDVIDRFF